MSKHIQIRSLTPGTYAVFLDGEQLVGCVQDVRVELSPGRPPRVELALMGDVDIDLPDAEVVRA